MSNIQTRHNHNDGNLFDNYCGKEGRGSSCPMHYKRMYVSLEVGTTPSVIHCHTTPNNPNDDKIYICIYKYILQ